MSRRIVIDKARESLVDELQKPETLQPASEPSDADLSIDELMKKGLKQIYMLMRVIHTDISTGSPSRETVMNLKDCMTMLHELKKKEQELLDVMSDEDIEKLAK